MRIIIEIDELRQTQPTVTSMTPAQAERDTATAEAPRSAQADINAGPAPTHAGAAHAEPALQAAAGTAPHGNAISAGSAPVLG